MMVFRVEENNVCLSLAVSTLQPSPTCSSESPACLRHLAQVNCDSSGLSASQAIEKQASAHQRLALSLRYQSKSKFHLETYPNTLKQQNYILFVGSTPTDLSLGHRPLSKGNNRDHKVVAEQRFRQSSKKPRERHNTKGFR